VAVQEGTADAFHHYVLPESFQEIQCTSYACVLAKGDQPVVGLICYFLVVNQSDIAG